MYHSCLILYFFSLFVDRMPLKNQIIPFLFICFSCSFSCFCCFCVVVVVVVVETPLVIRNLVVMMMAVYPSDHGSVTLNVIVPI